MCKLVKILAVVWLMVALSGCGHMYKQLTNPTPWGLGETPDGPPEFKKGWEDGCETGVGVYGNDRYKLSYTYKQDANMMNNPVYYRAWRDSYTYCRWYTYNWVTNWD